MTEAEWLASADPFAMLAHLEPWSADRKRVLFGCACLRASPYRNSPDVRQAIQEAELRVDAGPYTPIPVTHPGYPELPDLDADLARLVAVMFSVGTADDVAHQGAIAMTGMGEFDSIPVPKCAAECAQLLRCVVPYPPPAPATKPRGWLASAGAGILNLLAGNPARPAARKTPSPLPLAVPECDPSWLTSTVVALAGGIYEERAFDRLPILADALMDAGCDHADVLPHCRAAGPHVRGCWVVDLLLGKA